MTIVKHVFHVIHVGNVPIIQRLIEIGTTRKHTPHASNPSNIPVIQGLIERFAVIEHVWHIWIWTTIHIPDPIVQWLIKSQTVIKCIKKVLCFAQVGVVNILSELHVFTTHKSITHIRPNHRAKLFNLQQLFWTAEPSHISLTHLKTIYPLRACFYKNLAVLRRSVPISPLNRNRWLVFQDSTITCTFNHQFVIAPLDRDLQFLVFCSLPSRYKRFFFGGVVQRLIILNFPAFRIDKEFASHFPLRIISQSPRLYCYPLTYICLCRPTFQRLRIVLGAHTTVV